MANIPISSLPTTTSVSSTDLVPLVHNSTTVGATVQQILDALERRDTVLSVPADGTASAITFLTPFTNSVGVVTCTPAKYSGTDNAAISWHIVGDPTKTGFSVVVGGGQTGSTVTLHYRASGS